MILPSFLFCTLLSSAICPTTIAPIMNHKQHSVGTNATLFNPLADKEEAEKKQKEAKKEKEKKKKANEKKRKEREKRKKEAPPKKPKVGMVAIARWL